MERAWRRWCLALAAMTGVATGAWANDSASEFGIGGLVMVKTDAITMQREDLTITPNFVTVRYEFRNDGPDPVTLRVAFPLPEVPVDMPGGQMIGQTKVDVHPLYPPNFVSFSVQVDGRRVEPEIEVRAELPDGRSVLEQLREIGGWSLVLRPRMFPNPVLGGIAPEDVGRRMFREMESLGALEPQGDVGDGYAWSRWTTRITFHWMQTFQPGVTVVEHSYRPLIGYSPMSVGDDGTWYGPMPDQGGTTAEAYCIDADAGRDLKALPAWRYGHLLTRTMAYVLTTGANWGGPIETFNLVIDASRGRHDWNKVRFAVGCSDLPLRRVGPTRLEATVRNYVPTRDLRILLVTDLPD